MMECEHAPKWESLDPIVGKFAVYLVMNHQITMKQWEEAGKPPELTPEVPDEWRTHVLNLLQLPKDKRGGVVITADYVQDHPVPGESGHKMADPVVRSGKRHAPSSAKEDDKGEGPSQKRRRVSVRAVRSSSPEMAAPAGSPPPAESPDGWESIRMKDNFLVTRELWESFEQFEERKKVKLQLRNLQTAQKACGT